MSQIIDACRDVLRAGIDLLFPPACVGCGRRGEHWCRACCNQVAVIKGSLCPRCGSPSATGSHCVYCQSIVHLAGLRSYAWYRGAIIAPVLAIKYRPNSNIVNQLGSLMAELVVQSRWRPEVVMGVPLGQARFWRSPRVGT